MAVKFKKVKDAKKQKKLWDKLIIGDKPFEECGEPWDEWNTVIIPARIKEKEEKEKFQFWKMFRKLDINKDGVVNIADAPKDK